MHLEQHGAHDAQMLLPCVGERHTVVAALGHDLRTTTKPTDTQAWAKHAHTSPQRRGRGPACGPPKSGVPRCTQRICCSCLCIHPTEERLGSCMRVPQGHPHRQEAGLLHAGPPRPSPQRRGRGPACGSPKSRMPRCGRPADMLQLCVHPSHRGEAGLLHAGPPRRACLVPPCDHAPAVHAYMHARPLSIHPASRSPPSSCTRVPQSIVHAVRARGARRAVCPLTAR